MTDTERLRNLERHYCLERAENHQLRDALGRIVSAIDAAPFNAMEDWRQEQLSSAYSAALKALETAPPTEWTPSNEDAASAAPLSARDQSCPAKSRAFGSGNHHSSPTSDISG